MAKKMDFDTVWERIKNNSDIRTFIDLAAAVNVQQSAISKKKKSGRFPAEWIFILANKYNLTSDFLAFGGSPQYRDGAGLRDLSAQSHKQDTEPRLLPISEVNQGWTKVPQYRDRLSAGPGTFVENGGGDTVGSFTFKTSWLSRKCQPNQCAVFHVSGDSMFPMIQDGDVVLVDMAQSNLQEVREGKIYAYSEGDLIRVKRLIYKGSGELWAISDNKQVSPDSPIDMATFSMIGRVVWIGHEVW